MDPDYIPQDVVRCDLFFNTKKTHIQRVTEELEKQFLSAYEDIANDLEMQIAMLDGEYKKLTTEISKQRDEIHREVDNAFDQMEKEIDEMVKHHSILRKHLDEIKQLQSRIQQTLNTLHEMEESNEVSAIINYSCVLQKTIQTKSGYCPYDIAVDRDGALLYIDWTTRTVYKVKYDQTGIITLKGWRPINLCIASSGDLMVTMFSENETQSKVIRYSGSAVKQTIQFDDEGQPLYSGYNGHPSPTKNKPFKPVGITTDSQTRILTADKDNHCIHIIDAHGQFLRYIDNCGLSYPCGVCVDSNDSLFVCEYFKGNVIIIRYSKQFSPDDV
uniref:Uncharacterized protein LOC111107585 n=1 Tax=Crassostrea virginica TaxID=6565 RepID=A0A8B8B568_CRAVI|nr:uncharacterized protein LOC111107585 [Crassostrea virginica]